VAYADRRLISPKKLSFSLTEWIGATPLNLRAALAFSLPKPTAPFHGTLETYAANGLSHYLHTFIRSMDSGKAFDPGRTAAEVIAVEKYIGRIQSSQSDNNYDNFLDLLISLNSYLTGSTAHFRRQQVHLTSGTGTYIVLKWSQDDLHDTARELLSVLTSKSVCAFVKAVTCYVAILNAHPFADGNGRTARVMFNALFDKLEVIGYIPIYEISLATKGSYELCLRDLELRSDHRPICRFLLQSAVVTHRYL
jgi:hypothetical protein